MSFENVMMKRLAECGAEACREVERGHAIEVLPPKETRETRRESRTAYCERTSSSYVASNGRGRNA